MATQYADILNTARDDIKEPQPLPLGSYVAMVKGLPRIDKGGKNNNDFAEYEFSLVSAGADVDQNELAAAGGLPRDLKHTFWITPKSLFIIERFFEAAQIDRVSAPTISEALTQTPGRSVTIQVVLGKANAKTGKQYAEISNFAPA